MLNVGSLNEGIVLDHIKAGKAMSIYKYLGLDKLDCQVAIIKNARSDKMGRKDIIKIEGSIDLVDLDILGFIDHDITVNIIQDGKICEKEKLTLPNTIKIESLYCSFLFIWIIGWNHISDPWSDRPVYSRPVH